MVEKEAGHVSSRMLPSVIGYEQWKTIMLAKENVQDGCMETSGPHGVPMYLQVDKENRKVRLSCDPSLDYDDSVYISVLERHRGEWKGEELDQLVKDVREGLHVRHSRELYPGDVDNCKHYAIAVHDEWDKKRILPRRIVEEEVFWRQERDKPVLVWLYESKKCHVVDKCLLLKGETEDEYAIITYQ